MSSLYGGLLGCIAEAADIQRELGVSFDEATAIQRERAEARLAAETKTDDEIRRERVAERVATSLNCTPAEAREQLDYWDAVHAELFAQGNVIPFRARN